MLTYLKRCSVDRGIIFFLIFGIHLECPPASYGRDCLQICNANCYMSQICDRKIGVCIGGCVKGWKPPLCNEGTCTVLNTSCHSDIQIDFINDQDNRWNA